MKLEERFNNFYNKLEKESLMENTTDDARFLSQLFQRDYGIKAYKPGDNNNPEQEPVSTPVDIKIGPNKINQSTKSDKNPDLINNSSDKFTLVSNILENDEGLRNFSKNKFYTPITIDTYNSVITPEGNLRYYLSSQQEVNALQDFADFYELKLIIKPDKTTSGWKGIFIFNTNESLTESIRNVFEFTVVEKDDRSYQDTVEAYTWKQAQHFAHEKYPKCLIRDMRQITDNKEPEETEKQISMFDEK